MPGFSIAPAAKKPSPLDEFFKNKRNIFICLGAAAFLFLAFIIIIIIAVQPKTIRIDDYFTVTVEGSDGFGRARVEWDEEKLAEISREVAKRGRKKEKEKLTDALGGLGGALSELHESTFRLRYFVNVKLDPSSGLKNGDEITVTAEASEEFEKTYDVKIKLREDKIKVKDLPGITEFDPLKNITLRYEGFEGYGNVLFDLPSDAQNESFGTVSYRAGNNQVQVTLQSADGTRRTVTYSFKIPENLKNGDKITVSLEGANTNEELASALGVTLTAPSEVYTADGLTPLVSCDPSELVTLTGEGYSGHATASLKVKKESVKQGDQTLLLSADEGWSTLYLRIGIQSGGETVHSLSYTAKVENDGELKNGDKLVFTADDYDIEAARSRGGIELPKSFSCELSGLKTATAADPLSALTVSYTGYEEYGKAVPALSAATVKAGDYTMKLTLNEDYSHSLTVIVADKTDKNLFSLTYSLDKSSSLKNGDELRYYHRSSSGIRNLDAALENYGLEFPEEKTFKVSSLKATTAVDLREYLSYSFSGENGSIGVTASLTKSSLTAGGYTITMEIAQEREWWNDYLREKFTVTDAAGTVVATGCYQIGKITGYSEGDVMYVEERFDQREIVEATGLLFSTESKQVIVSTR